MRVQPDPSPAWQLVIPVKDRHSAKSRLRPPTGLHRQDLAHAFAMDTIAVAAQTVSAQRLLVVTSDNSVSEPVRRLGVRVLPDPGEGLNAAVLAGMRSIESGWVGALLGDLPAVRVVDLSAALVECARHACAFVPDAEGVGTVLLTARSPRLLMPRFGTGSAAAHARFAVRLDLPLPRLRGDVDDDASLRRAQRLGVGQYTAAALSPPVG